MQSWELRNTRSIPRGIGNKLLIGEEAFTKEGMSDEGTRDQSELDFSQ